MSHSTRDGALKPAKSIISGKAWVTARCSESIRCLDLFRTREAAVARNCWNRARARRRFRDLIVTDNMILTRPGGERRKELSMTLPPGVTLSHPNELYIGGRWVAPV